MRFSSITFVALGLMTAGAFADTSATVEMPVSKLADKIKGGWAGQTIGVSFGSHTEFRYNGTFIQDGQVIPWSEGQVKRLMAEWPDLYDDIYMDLTFVQVMEQKGLDSPVEEFAQAFAHAGYNLWHANQAARYNILQGIMPPDSGHWRNNPHADDIDYQIEADFAGLMCPGMPNAASAISDKVGHIMNYGDGWYGGVFVGAMYTQAFVHDDIRMVVTEALKTVPAESDFHKCIADVIRWHDEHPDDWKQTWFEIQKKWADEVGCPGGVFKPLNIDAKVNAAYIVLGLLYGQGDFTRTLEISTRAGQDSDCNPSSAAGILGTLHGYSAIPPQWMAGLKDGESTNFSFTSMTLTQVYDVGLSHSLEMIRRNGGQVEKDRVVLPIQVPQAVWLEKSFEGCYPVKVTEIGKPVAPELTFEVEGTGFVLDGAAVAKPGIKADYVFEAECYIDGKLAERAKLPTNGRARRNELFWKYELPKGKHSVRVVIKNPSPDHTVQAYGFITYSDAWARGMEAHR